jgi:hypothetical protein
VVVAQRNPSSRGVLQLRDDAAISFRFLPDYPSLDYSLLAEIACLLQAGFDIHVSQ